MIINLDFELLNVSQITYFFIRCLMLTILGPIIIIIKLFLKGVIMFNKFNLFAVLSACLTIIMVVALRWPPGVGD